MPAIDSSDNPIRGFRIISYSAGANELYLRCRGKECSYFKRLPLVINLDAVIDLAYKHRSECDKPIQRLKANRLSIHIKPK